MTRDQIILEPTKTPAALRIAIVSPRYGAEIGGGAEGLARSIAHLISDVHDVTVLTTCATDYRTWANNLPPGSSDDGPVRVLRFPVDAIRDMEHFDAISPMAYANPSDLSLGTEWMEAQGPSSSGLRDHLRSASARYDCVIFIPYLYATTQGLLAADVPTILVPCAHDEPPFVQHVFDNLFARASGLVFNTPEEQALVVDRFQQLAETQQVISGAISPPDMHDGRAFRESFQLDERPYIVCVGRIEPSKGTHWIVDQWPRLHERHPTTSLVLIGHEHVPVPRHPGIIVTGFVDEATKLSAIAGSSLVVLPSEYESLSIVALEAWLQGRPTLANAASPVLVGQTTRSNGGLWYQNQAEYQHLADFLIDYPMVGNVLGAQGHRWARVESSPVTVRTRWIEMIRAVAISD
jgi:glycosyltransferase involved in cell wall biosynthesis